tara:strand:- start:2863 stop:3537 length:675 start_codon:yes stop_codon:yes gene_type:complete
MSKENYKQLIEKESENLNNLLEIEELKEFKMMTSELKDTWEKKQMFRTETEARFSVLQDNRYTTPAAKYWQCVREQASYIDNLMVLSFEYRRNQAKINKLEEQIRTEEDEHEKVNFEIDLDECRFNKASMERQAHHRMREIKMWSKLKKEFDDGSFDTKDVNQHQLESYGRQYAIKAKNLTENSDEADKFNVLGQLESLQRIKKSGELLSNEEKEKLNHEKSET